VRNPGAHPVLLALRLLLGNLLTESGAHE
jgi:hypothetical protein